MNMTLFEWAISFGMILLILFACVWKECGFKEAFSAIFIPMLVIEAMLFLTSWIAESL